MHCSLAMLTSRIWTTQAYNQDYIVALFQRSRPSTSRMTIDASDQMLR